MKTLYETDDAKLVEGDGVILIGLRAWGHTSSIRTEIWTRMVQAWLDSREGPLPPCNEVWTVSKDELATFYAEAAAHSMVHETGGEDLCVVELRKVKRLLFNLASGRSPEAPCPPSWVAKDVVGLLQQRGWVIDTNWGGMQRRRHYITEESLAMNFPGSVEEQADELELRLSKCGWHKCENYLKHHPDCDCGQRDRR